MKIIQLFICIAVITITPSMYSNLAIYRKEENYEPINAYIYIGACVLYKNSNITKCLHKDLLDSSG